MTMPVDLVLVRHGESEGNVANKRSRRGDNSAFTKTFRGRHSSAWRLTDRGKQQADIAGRWIRQHIGRHFDRYYVSEYLRAMETAALLKLPDAEWYKEFYLRERDWGELDVMPEDERRRRFADALRRREADSFFWTPPGGESMAQLCLRVDRVLNTLHRECSDMRVIIVCHGEVMWAFRVRLERMSQQRFRALDESSHPHDHIHNCQVIHYTRRDPSSDTLGKRYDWMRSVCPTDPTKSFNLWAPIARERHSNADLLKLARQTRRLIRR